MDVVILTESELREAVAAIEEAFGLLAQGKVNMPPIMHIEVPEFEGDVDIKSAYVQGLESFAVKIGAGFFNNYRLGVEVVACADAAEVVRESNVVVTSTPARDPYLKAEWIHPGLHITCMGADLPEKQELKTDVLARADLLVCDRKSQSFKMGELHHGIAAGVISGDADVVELGQISSGRKNGRTGEDQITICDLTGTGAQDTAVAVLALKKAAALGLGQTIIMR
jgi:ornithine cyclodeaminase/alanine dehydrogenase-like protein (mu-crystallin family)